MPTAESASALEEPTLDHSKSDDPAAKSETVESPRLKLGDILRILDQPVRLEMNDATPQDFCRLLEQKTGLPLRIDQRALDAAGIKLADLRFTITDRSIALANLLDEFLTSQQLAWCIGRGHDHLLLTTPEIHLKTKHVMLLNLRDYLGSELTSDLSEEAANTLVELISMHFTPPPADPDHPASTASIIRLGGQPIVVLQATSGDLLAGIRFLGETSSTLRIDAHLYSQTFPSR
ncbi:MAG: hypothetical protein SFX18_14885 [Pirellulales bacterium]|nr:hypothetical protein [Pirellulales bacterium]